jgi:hypothetical protein
LIWHSRVAPRIPQYVVSRVADRARRRRAVEAEALVEGFNLLQFTNCDPDTDPTITVLDPAEGVTVTLFDPTSTLPPVGLLGGAGLLTLRARE